MQVTGKETKSGVIIHHATLRKVEQGMTCELETCRKKESCSKWRISFHAKMVSNASIIDGVLQMASKKSCTDFCQPKRNAKTAVVG
jgi:hypothetical protein